MKKRIIILEPFQRIDKTATGVRSLALFNYLRSLEYDVEVLYPDQNEYSDLVKRRNSLIGRVREKILGDNKKSIEYCHWYAKNVGRKINNKENDILLARGQIAGWLFVNKNLKGRKILDLANVEYLEKYYGGENEFEVNKIFKREMKVYENSDYILCHHDILKQFIKENVFNSEKIITVRMGSYKTDKKAKFSLPVKIVHAGGGNYYIHNSLLLSRISAMLPKQIDCYGTSDQSLPFYPHKINYKGCAPNLDFLADYQFGLITVSRDILRQYSPSTKFADYFSYGLPVFFPEWLKEGYSYNGCIPYNEKNVLEIVNKYANREIWEELHCQVLKQVQELTWDKVLKPLAEIIEGEE
jgi:hypothetical protein